MMAALSTILRPTTWSILALVVSISIPVHAESFWADPLRTANNISTTPAAALTGSCGFNAQLPNPLTLLDAVERALCRNPQTRQAWANVKVQAAALGIRRATYLPDISAGSSLSNASRRTNFPDSPAYDSELNTRSTSAHLNLNWVLFDFGLRAANLENARQLLNAANATQNDVLQTVFLATVQSWLF